MRRGWLVYGLVVFWACVFVWSILAAKGIDGPANIDTGFKRLDTLFRGQLIAIGIALVAAVAGFAFSDRGSRLRWIGLIPLVATLIIIAGTVLFALFQPKTVPLDNTLTPTESAPALTTPSAD